MSAKLALKNGTNNVLVGVNGTPALDIPFNLPSDLGESGMVLTTDASGNLSWDWPVEGMTGTYTFVNGLTNTSGTVKLGGNLLAGDTTNLTLLTSNDSSTSFNIKDSNNLSGFSLIKSNDTTSGQEANSTELILKTGHVYNNGVTLLDMSNVFNIKSNRYITNVFGTDYLSHNNGLNFSSLTTTINGANRSKLDLLINSSVDTAGSISRPQLKLDVYDTTSDSNSLSFIVNLSSGLRLYRSYTGLNNLYTSTNTYITSKVSTSTSYSDLNKIYQTFVFNSDKKQVNTDVNSIAHEVSFSGTYAKWGSGDTNNATVYLKTLLSKDSLNRVIGYGYPAVSVIPIDIALATTIGGTSYNKSVFKVDLTSNGDNYILDTYPILVGSAYTSVTTGSLFTVKNNGSTRLRLLFDGKLGINVSNSSTGYYLPNDASATAGNFLMSGLSQTTYWSNAIRMIGSNLHVAGDIVANSTSSLSDINLKTDIVKVDGEAALDLINVLNPVYFKYKDDLTETHIGLIAQELEEYIPELVKETEGIKRIRYTELIGLLIAAVKELDNKINNI